MTNLSPTDQRVLERLKVWREDPVRFVEDNFKVQPDHWQREFLYSVRDNKRTGAKACKGPGKTAVMSWVGWWFLSVFPDVRGFATSLTGDMLRDTLWSEFAFWRKKSPFLMEFYDWSAERIYHKGHQDTWYISARTWPRQADASQQANTLAGLHGDNTIILIDEAGDIPLGVTAAADASLTTGKMNRIAMAGNPTSVNGSLYGSLVGDAHLWHVITITGDPDDPKRSNRIDKEWAREQIAKLGRDHDWVKVNILGQFPAVAADKLLGPEQVDAAMGRKIPEAEYLYAPKIMGVDVARYGDDQSVIAIRQGKALFRPRTYRNLDLMSLASEIAHIIEEETPLAVFVDETGIGGGVIDWLRQIGAVVVGVNFGGKPRDSRYQDRRTEMWVAMSEWVKSEAAMPVDATLRNELLAPSYGFTPTNRMKLESKAELKERGVGSPDVADAVALTFAEPVFVPYGYGTDIWPIAQKQLGRVAHDYDPYAAEVR